MNVDWKSLEEVLRANRRSGSTTVAMKAAKEHGAVLVAHNEEYASEIGGVSPARLARKGIRAPLLFDNGLLINMCEEMRSMQRLEWEIESLEQQVLELESDRHTYAQKADYNARLLIEREKAIRRNYEANIHHFYKLRDNPLLGVNCSVEIAVCNMQDKYSV